VYDKDDEEADLIYDAVDERQDEKRKDHRCEETKPLGIEQLLTYLLFVVGRRS